MLFIGGINSPIGRFSSVPQGRLLSCRTSQPVPLTGQAREFGCLGWPHGRLSGEHDDTPIGFHG